jgi:hypothetical protein
MHDREVVSIRLPFIDSANSGFDANFPELERIAANYLPSLQCHYLMVAKSSISWSGGRVLNKAAFL